MTTSRHSNDDTIGFIYDTDAAEHFIRTTTGLAEDVVKRASIARELYHLGLELLPAEAIENETAAEVRATQPDLFPAEHIASRFLSPPLEREFIVRTTSISATDVRAFQDAEHAYMQKVGIVD
jgi:hypothetical protein